MISHNFHIKFWRETIILLFLFFIALAVRFPFIFPSVLDWDESTFIIVGQSTLDGFLPGEIAWEMKPSFVFLWFSGVIGLVGKSIPAIRLAGICWIVLSAYVIYRAALFATRSKLGAIFAAIMIVAGSSNSESMHVSSEILALLPLSAAVLVLSNRRANCVSYFFGGFFLGTACMFRLNLAYLCIIVGAYLCAQPPYSSWKAFLSSSLRTGFWFSVGILSPIFISFLPYLVMGRAHLWIGIFEVGIRYSESQLSFTNLPNTLNTSFADVIGKTMWGAAALGAWTVRRRWNGLGKADRFNWVLYGVFVIGSSLSIVLTGPFYKHYLVQLVPGLAMFAGAIFIPSRTSSNLCAINAAKFALGSSLVALSIFQTSAVEWSKVIYRLEAGEELSSGSAYEMASLIRSQGLKDYSIFMLEDHIVYWLLGKYPPTPLATHPSALAKWSTRNFLEPDSKTTVDALRNVFLREPTFVVWGAKWFSIDAEGECFLKNELSTKYKVIATFGKSQIFRRNTSFAGKNNKANQSPPTRVSTASTFGPPISLKSGPSSGGKDRIRCSAREVRCTAGRLTKEPG